ncbi:hypothetical protein [Mycolicibacterium tusciae]|uniref:Uncharacterized protein n=2 Tax=Mycolicibacterium TaxID=1866885 RepID=A0A1X0JF01_9MYCO|nr:hypothetical protein [Mycolicibacterium tusciae]ORB61301.1 hypothetical protein BST47_28260 [Mycolicibacterium tusciae]
MSAALHTTPAEVHPAEVWAGLAPLAAAPGRHQMRLWTPDTGKFSQTAKLTAKWPTQPAAVYLYSANATTVLLALDFDTSRGDAAAVERDLRTAENWLIRCGARVVTDYTDDGGRHLLCPLAIGTTASLPEVTALMRVLAGHLPTLDIAPALNPAQGCISLPGTLTKRGGYRHLDGTLTAARAAFIERSEPGMLPRLYQLLGMLKPATPDPSPPEEPHDASAAGYTTGEGEDRRLTPAYTRTDPLPDSIAAFATRGDTAPTDRPHWKSPSEARFATVVAALDRGHTAATLRDLIAPDGPWHDGLGHAYKRYGHGADRALLRDIDRAFDWLIANPLLYRRPQHKQKYTQGGSLTTATHKSGFTGPPELRHWLANAFRWADLEYAGQRYRWTVHAVLQTLAVHALKAGDKSTGTWVVGVGGRSLSLGAGLLSPDAVWRVLRDLRDRQGSPIVLVRSHMGLEADYYALTSQNNVIRGLNHHCERVRIEAVHDIWHILGHHLRRIYELIAHHGLTHREDIYAAAAVSRSTGDDAVRQLQIHGLIAATAPKMLGPGPITPHTLAEAHQLPHLREQRQQTYREQRAQWQQWLDIRERLKNADVSFAAASAPGGDADQSSPPYNAFADTKDYLESVLRTGPPEDIERLEDHAIGLIETIMGATLLTRRAAAPPKPSQ